ncbi:MAG: SIMPL domain-containing protein [Puniceicoccales bacterium]
MICFSAVVAVIAASVIIAKPWVTVRHAEPIVVKGYAEKAVKADAGSVTASVTTTGETNAQAYTRAGESLDAVRALAVEILGGEFEVIELPSSVHGVAELNDQGKKTNRIDFYQSTRSLRINTQNVAGLETLGRALFDLNADGINISVGGPEFFVSELEGIKLELVKEATANGRDRARLMAESSGEKLGELTAARQGVIQITKKNSTETASWGVYDTETIDKVVKLVVTVEYAIGG